MKNPLLELYSDYLISSFALITATGLSLLLDNEYSHDQITRFLSGDEYTSRDLWALVKPTVRAVETDDSSVLFDDTIQEKPHSDENEIIAWHFDHSKNRSVKGVNILNCLYNAGDVNLPLAFEIVHKDLQYCEIETKKLKRKSSITKNEHLREMLRVCQQNQLCYRYVLADTWFSSKENMIFIKVELGKEFVMPLKSNRTVALSLEDKRQGRFVRVDALPLEENTVLQVYIKGLSFPVVLAKQVFTNKDGSIGVLYLATSDLLLDYGRITTIYKKRWNVEVFHKSIKSNTGLARSPTHTVRTQSNHFFASIYAFFKLELLKVKHQLNHFALRSKLYIKALQASFAELQRLTA
ncbi:MAG: IS701 family transposase [Candidatus Methylumidiphilus alinenensis]|uniref:IS701 family transposase n=1 Tax=Candidatus Methylumidiphilus alinenensis TaxID=2202197 RepID=A0A2W4QLY6_9GAMM|nr:MAG: IS701 family transposase [Candidatus Methylumidiphilus alinenensis]